MTVTVYLSRFIATVFFYLKSQKAQQRKEFQYETRRKINEVAEGRGAGQDSTCQACGSTAGREAERTRPSEQTQVYDGRYCRKILP